MKFWDALWRRSREADKKAADAIDVKNPEKQRQILEDSNAEIDRFEGNLAELRASRKGKERQLNDLNAQVQKYEGFAKRAGEAGNEADLRSALTQKLNFQKQADAMKAEIDRDNALETKQVAQLRDARDKVAMAESKSQSLKVREDSAKIRQSFANNSVNKAGSALAQLEDWEREVEKQEALAESREELAGEGSEAQNLEKKYGGSSSQAVEDEMSKYLKQPA